MSTPDPEQVNFFLEHIGKIFAAAAAALLAASHLIGKNKKAEAAKNILTEKPVSRVELLEFQISITKDFNSLIDEHFKELRGELLTEIKEVHSRIDSLHIKVGNLR